MMPSLPHLSAPGARLEEMLRASPQMASRGISVVLPGH